MTRALLIVDMQYDFIEGGALPVAGGTGVAQRTAELLMDRPGLYTSVFTSQDWHHPLPDLNGGHFAPEGADPDYVDSWPVHCVAGTDGARLEAGLDSVLTTGPMPVTRVRKGQGRPDYSAFQGRVPGKDWTLPFALGAAQVTSLDVCGLATDHCVYQSALDALKLAPLHEVRVIRDLCAGVSPGLTAAALDDMQQMGARLTTTSYL